MADPALITIDKDIMGGMPTIAGTRLTIAQLFKGLACGRTVVEMAVDWEVSEAKLIRLMHAVSSMYGRMAEVKAGDQIADMDAARRNSATVAAVFDAGGGPADCVIPLVRAQVEFVERITELSSIVPRKVRTAHGRVFIWRCADEEVPEYP